ncbi:MAG: hypothetical protein ACLU24_01685 [Candidatus Pseudoruminococcus sp.]
MSNEIPTKNKNTLIINQIYDNFIGKVAQVKIHILKVYLAKIPVKIEQYTLIVKTAQKIANLFYE